MCKLSSKEEKSLNVGTLGKYTICTKLLGWFGSTILHSHTIRCYIDMLSCCACCFW